MELEDKEWFSSGEVAELYGVHYTTISTWCKDGALPGVRKMNPLVRRSPYMIPRETVQKLLDGSLGDLKNNNG